MDEGLAEWQMPNKEKGFYKAWRKLAKYDDDINVKHIQDIPKTSIEALEQVLQDISEADYIKLFKNHLAALPGWTGYINHRNQYNSPWQQTYPITLQDYLAVRLWIAKNLNSSIYSKDLEEPKDESQQNLQYIWLKAWEKSWQNQMINDLKIPSKDLKADETRRLQMHKWCFVLTPEAN